MRLPSVRLAFEVIEPITGVNENLSPIIYLNGLGGSKELWHNIPQIIADKTKRRSYTYDARNHGDSEWAEVFSLYSNIPDLYQFMNSRNIQKAILIGHDMGGWTASMFALQWPNRVEMLVVENMFLDDNVLRKNLSSTLELLKLWETAVKKIPTELNEEEGIKYSLDYVYKNNSSGIIPLKNNLKNKQILYKYKYPIKRGLDGYDVKHNMSAICKYLKDFMDSKATFSQEGKYSGPAYFIYTQISSSKLDMEDEKMRNQFPHAKTEVLKNVSHNMHLECPDLFTERVLSFYEKNY